MQTLFVLMNVCFDISNDLDFKLYFISYYKRIISEVETRERDVAAEDRVVRSEQRDERPRRKVETRQRHLATNFESSIHCLSKFLTNYFFICNYS